MSKKSHLELLIDTMKRNGYKLHGKLIGTYSFKPGSKLIKYLDDNNLDENNVMIRNGARANLNEWELLVFVKE